MSRDRSEDDGGGSFDVFVRSFRLAKAVVVGVGGVIGALVALAALKIAISPNWTAIALPLWQVVLIAAGIVCALGAAVVVLVVLLRSAMANASFYQSKSISLETKVAGLRDLAYTDPITGLPNTNALKRLLEEEAGPAQRCLILLDLRDFGRINREYGHAAGDAYLREFARMVFVKSRRDEGLYKRRPTPLDLEVDGVRVPSSESAGEKGIRASDPRTFRKTEGGDEFFMLLEGGLVDGLGFLNRLIKQKTEFEERLSQRALDGGIHEFGFQAGLITMAAGDAFEGPGNAYENVAACLRQASQPDSDLRVYWPPELAESASPGLKQAADITRELFSRNLRGR